MVMQFRSYHPMYAPKIENRFPATETRDCIRICIDSSSVLSLFTIDSGFLLLHQN